MLNTCKCGAQITVAVMNRSGAMSASIHIKTGTPVVTDDVKGFVTELVHHLQHVGADVVQTVAADVNRFAAVGVRRADRARSLDNPLRSSAATACATAWLKSGKPCRKSTGVPVSGPPRRTLRVTWSSILICLCSMVCKRSPQAMRSSFYWAKLGNPLAQ